MSQYDKMIKKDKPNSNKIVLQGLGSYQFAHRSIHGHNDHDVILNNTTKESKNMSNTLRTITLTLIDNNDNLEDTQRIVFKKKGYLTSFTDQQAKEDIIATGDVKKALEVHNKEVRANVIREDILENTGREVKLKPIKLLSDPQLVWRIVETA